MDLAVLKAEVNGDPLGRGYAGMSDSRIADSLNAANRTKSKDVLSGDEVFGATNGVEFAALTAAKQQMWVSFCARPSISQIIQANVDFVKFIFGNASATVVALQATRSIVGSRAEELGLGVVTPSDVANAKRSA